MYNNEILSIDRYKQLISLWKQRDSKNKYANLLFLKIYFFLNSRVI